MLSLWTDETMTSCEFVTDTPYTPFNIYVFLHPDDDGAYSVTFKISGPQGHVSPEQTPNPVVSGAAMGAWYGAPGIEAPFMNCKSELFWVVRLTMTAPDITPGFYGIFPHDDSQFMGVAICPGDRPLRAADRYNCFGYNDSCMWCWEFYSTEETSWGAIKALYRQ